MVTSTTIFQSEWVDLDTDFLYTPPMHIVSFPADSRCTADLSDRRHLRKYNYISWHCKLELMLFSGEIGGQHTPNSITINLPRSMDQDLLIFAGSYEILKYIRKPLEATIVAPEIKTCILSNHSPDVKRTIALRHANSAASTWRLRYFSTCSWKILTLSIKVTILSGDMWFEWIPAVANRGATWRGIGHWAAFSTNNSLQTKRRSATWSVTAKSGKKGIFLAHSTALKSKRAANSQMFSMPMIPQGMFRPCWNRAVGYGSALSSKLMNPERNECPFVTSAPFNAECCGLGWGTCVGGMRPRWTAVVKRWKGSFNMLLMHLQQVLTTIVKVTLTDLLLIWKFLTRTLASHADLDAFSQPAILTLISMMLINGAIPRCSTSVAEVTANAALEKRLTSLTGKHSIMFSRGLVATNCALYLLHIFFRRLLNRFGLLRAPGWNRDHGHTTR